MKPQNSVYVLASMNVDIVVKVKDFPKPGETIFGSSLERHFGGKGGNQAVAARRVGAFVYGVGKVGADGSGEEYLKSLRESGMNTDYIVKQENCPTGTAIINVDEKGENNIIVVPGANAELTEEDIERTREVLADCKVIVSQFELPIAATRKAFLLAKEYGCITIFNPAPAKEMPEDFFGLVDVLIPNEGELGQLLGISVESQEEAEAAAKTLLKKGISYVLVTLGSKGSLLVGKGESTFIPARKVKAVDTTAAGDSFVGALAARIAQTENLNRDSLLESVRFATVVASLAVQKKGAQTSLPSMEEVLEVL